MFTPAKKSVPLVEDINKIYKKAHKGDAEAQLKLGLILTNGARKIAKDEKQAVVWFTKAAKQGNAQAQNFLGFHLQYGLGVTKDEKQALEWYRQSAELGFAEAQFNLGQYLKDGIIIAKNEKEAVQWYRKAAEQGCVAAQNNLALCLSTGTGTAKNEKEAVQWYRKAAEVGNAFAQTNLAHCLIQGNGTAKDEKQAVVLYRKAAEQGSEAAINALEYLLKKGIITDKDEKQTLSQRKEVEQKEGTVVSQTEHDIRPPSSTPSKPIPVVPEKNKATLELAVDAAFSSAKDISSDTIPFDKSQYSPLKILLREKCKEQKIDLTKRKFDLIITTLKSKVNHGNVLVQDIVQVIQEQLWSKESAKSSVKAAIPPEHTKIEEKASKLIKESGKYQELININNEIQAKITDFENTKPLLMLDKLIEPFTKDSLPTRQAREHYSKCKGAISQHETNKKLFLKMLERFNAVSPDNEADEANLKIIDKLMDQVLVYRAEINNTVTTFNKHKEFLAEELNEFDSNEKQRKRFTKNTEKQEAVLEALKNKRNKKIEKQQEEKQRKERLATTKGSTKHEVQAIRTKNPESITEQKSAIPSKTTTAPHTHGRQRKLKILGSAVQHLLCIGILAGEYVDLLEAKEEKHREKQAEKEQLLTTLHFALLYNISRCFQALKVYKQWDEGSLKHYPKELLEDLRNMIVKLGALDADKAEVLATAKQLTKSLPREMCEMRKEYLTTPVLDKTQINDLVNVFGLVNDPERFELDAYPIPVDELPLYQQLAKCHESKTEAALTPKEFENKIWQKAIPIIKKIMESVSKVHPTAPRPRPSPAPSADTPSEEEKLNEYFWREMQALKILLSSCGVPYEVKECKKRKGLARKNKAQLKESAEATIQFYDFLAFCRKHITHQVGHEFENATQFLNYDVTVEKIYRACFKAQAITAKPYFGDLQTIREKDTVPAPIKQSAVSKQSVQALVERGSTIIASIREHHESPAATVARNSVARVTEGNPGGAEGPTEIVGLSANPPGSLRSPGLQ